MMIAIVLFIFPACQSQRSKAISNIEKIEKEVFTENGSLNRDKVNDLIAVYTGFADQFPGDTLASSYIFKAGDIAMNSNRSMEAIRFYDRILNDFPDYNKAPEAMFLKGYVYENNLGRLDKAKEIYEAFIAKYPNNEFADDAQVSLKYLGKSPEELIELFQNSEAAKTEGK
jgi:outer membrane protein assembly factor BamD (BamD/ComL family)